MKLNKTVLGIVLLAFVPVVPQILFGYGGHDFRQHVPSWLELRDLWQTGQFHPGWAPRANFTLGDPRFCYYPPISFIVGAALAMVLPLALVPAAFVWLTFAACGLMMYYASADFIADEDRWKAAVLYMASPYLLMTSLVRFAAAEVLTLAWLPLIFLFLNRAIWLRKRRATLLLGCFLALTWITNVPASIVLLYVLLTLLIVLAIWQRSIRPLLTLFVAECTAGALTAFYLIPTWLEQGWIHKDAVLRDNFELYFLFIPPHRLPLLLYGLAMWVFACAGTALVVLYAWVGRRDADNKRQTWLIVTLICFFFQLPLSVLLWKHLPQLRFADFPYRFLAPIGVAVPLMLLARSTPRKWRLPGYILLTLLALVPIREYRGAKSALVDLTALLPEWQQQGYRAWPEFVPAGATRPLGPLQIAPASVVDPVAGQNCTVAIQPSEYAHKVLITKADTPCQIRVAQYFYPYWRVVEESGVTLPISKDNYGLLLIRVPAGQHTIHLSFKPSSVPRTISLAISLVALFLVLLALLSRPRSASRAKHAGESNISRNQTPNQI